MEDRLALSTSSNGSVLQTVFEDPISMELMKDAVVLTTCGHSFSEATLEGWLNSGKKYCPLCQTPVKGPNAVKPNFTLREAIAQYQRVRKDNEEKTLAEEVAEIRSHVEQASSTPTLRGAIDMTAWTQINHAQDTDDWRMLVEVLALQGVDRGDKRDLHVVVKFKQTERRTSQVRHATPAWQGELLSFGLEEAHLKEPRDDDYIIFGLVEQTGVIFGKNDHVASARLLMKDVAGQRKLHATLPLTTHRASSHVSSTKMVLRVECQLVNLRYASKVLWASDLSALDAFSSSPSKNENKEAELAEEKKQRQRLLSLGTEAARNSPPVPPKNVATSTTTRASSVPMVRSHPPLPMPPGVRAPTPPQPPPPPPPAARANNNAGPPDLEQKVQHLQEMGFDPEWARRELLANGGDEEDAVLRMVGV